MKFIYFSIIFLLTWSSTLSCCSENLNVVTVQCNDSLSMSCEFFALKRDKKVIMTDGCYCNTDHIDCIKDNIKKVYGSSQLHSIDIVDIYCHINNTKELLEKFDLKELEQISYDDNKTESYVSIEKGVQSLVIDFMDKQINEASFIGYDNLTRLSMRTRKRELNMPVDTFSKLKYLKYMKWENGEPHVFSADLLDGLLDLEELIIVYQVPIDNKRIVLVNGECQLFPFNLKNLTRLRQLALVKTFPGCIRKDILKGFSRLEYLALTSNQKLKNLPMGIFKDLINLKNLVLHGNGLEILEDEQLHTLNKLELMDLSSNNFREINWEWPLLPNLAQLDLNTSQKLKTVHINLETGKFQILKYYERKAYINTDAFICDYVDKCLFVHDRNNYTCPEGCGCYYKQKANEFVVNCSTSDIKQLPYIPIPNFGNTTLDISNNKHLESLPTTSTYGYNEVRKLHATRNRFSLLKFNQLPENLYYLDLSNNRYTNIADEVLTFFHQRLKNNTMMYFKFGGNPWVCNCLLRPFLMFIQQYGQYIADEKFISCTGDFHDTLVVNMNEMALCPDKHL